MVSFIIFTEKLLLTVLTDSELVLLNCKFGSTGVYDGKSMYR